MPRECFLRIIYVGKRRAMSGELERTGHWSPEYRPLYLLFCLVRILQFTLILCGAVGIDVDFISIGPQSTVFQIIIALEHPQTGWNVHDDRVCSLKVFFFCCDYFQMLFRLWDLVIYPFCYSVTNTELVNKQINTIFVQNVNDNNIELDHRES